MPHANTPTQTVAVVQERGIRSGLTIHRIGGVDCRAEGAVTGQAIAVHAKVVVTAVAVVPHGVAVADDSGHINLYPMDLVESHPPSVEAMSQTVSAASIWMGTPVGVLSWHSPGCLFSGDRVGRLVVMDCESHISSPRIIAMANAPWIGILPIDEERFVALATDGDWVMIDDRGNTLSEGTLPQPNTTVTRVQWCGDYDLLLYQTTASTSNNSDPPETPHPCHQWCAWDMDRREPAPLPASLRYTQTLVATQHHVLAMNAQGQTFLWPPPLEVDTNASRAVSDVALEEADKARRMALPPQTIAGWPAGPTRIVLPIDDTPTLLHVDPFGVAHGLRLQGGAWCPHRIALPTSKVRHLWVAQPKTLARTATKRHEERLQQLTDAALQAHQEQRLDERNHLLEQLIQAAGAPQHSEAENTTDALPPSTGVMKANMLCARFLAEDGELLAALDIIQRVVVAAGKDASPSLARYYGRLLWRSGAINELCSYSQTDWPELYEGLRLDFDPQHIHRSILVDTYSPHPPSDCPWRDMAWASIEQHGTVSPYWLGAEPLTPFALQEDDSTLLKQVMAHCGAMATSLSVLCPGGSLHPATGWVWTDPIPGSSMHRQLVAWQTRHDTRCLHLRWAIKAECFESAAEWLTGWKALHDSAWRATSRRRVEIVRESIACGVAPGQGITLAAASAIPIPQHTDTPIEPEVHL